MLETDGFFRMAATNYQQAGSHLEDAEHELRKLLEKLETCLQLMKNASGAEPEGRQPAEQMGKNTPPATLERVEMVGS